MAQTLARHSDIRLTLGVDTHVELADQTAAIQALPVPPGPPASKGLMPSPHQLPADVPRALSISSVPTCPSMT
jgi:hypothetical protein